MKKLRMEQRRCLRIHSKRGSSFRFGGDRVKVHKPGFEEGARHLFERVVHAAVEFDLVVQRTEDASNGSLWFLARALQ